MTATDQRSAQVHFLMGDLLRSLNKCRLRTQVRRGPGSILLPRETFDGAEPFVASGVTHRDISKEVEFDDQGVRYIAEEAMAEVLRPSDFGGHVDYRLIVPVSGSRDELLVSRYVSVDQPLWELPGPMPRHIVAHEMMHLNTRTGIGKTVVLYYGTNGGRWVSLTINGPLPVTPDEMNDLQFALNIAFNRDYNWRVYLKWTGDKVGITLPTTPEGARELLRLRDYTPGASRRAALLHWVSKHSRRIRKDTLDETRIWVREHLRGETKFAWEDMEGTVHAAPYDLRRLADT